MGYLQRYGRTAVLKRLALVVSDVSGFCASNQGLYLLGNVKLSELYQVYSFRVRATLTTNTSNLATYTSIFYSASRNNRLEQYC